MQIVALGPAQASDGQAAAVHRVTVAALAVDEPDRPPPAPEDTAALLRYRRPSAGGAHYLAAAAGEVVGYARLALPGRDNAHLAFLTPVVHPDDRRRGIGTALLLAAVDRSAAEGRRTLLVEADAGTPGAAFCDAHGFDVAQADRSSLLRLSTVDWADVAELAGTIHSGYRLVGWEDACPDDLVERYARAKSAMNDAPVGEMDWDPLTYSAGKIREDEDVARQLGQQWRVVAAVHEQTGEVAGFTEVLISRWSPSRAQTDDTAVVPMHRGSGLGLWIKAEMMRRLRLERPEVAEVVTRNGLTNDHMWRINERLGFRAYGTTTERQARVAELAARRSS